MMAATAKRVTDEPNPVEKSQVQVIARAAAIMRALEDTTTGLSLGEIALKVGLARSTVQRIVAALEIEKLVVPASPSGRVRLGPAILRLAESVRTDFAMLAKPFLIGLSKELEETVDLASIKDDHLVFIDQVIGSQRLRTVSAVGEAFPLYCTANGKAFLAELEDSAIEDLLGKSYKPRTPNTLTSIDQLLEDIRFVRQNGYAIDREEHASGVCAAGVAMRDMIGNYVAISVPVPSQRFEREQSKICQRLLATKRVLQDRFSTVNT